jgi:serine/threonine protein kinase
MHGLGLVCGGLVLERTLVNTNHPCRLIVRLLRGRAYYLTAVTGSWVASVDTILTVQQIVNERYRVVKRLGKGGMAEVYLARDEVLGRDVALKVMRPQYADDEDFVERFRREAENAASLSHPNIVSVYERGETRDGTHYIVMEYVPGGTLKDLIKSDSPLPHGRVAAIAIQISQALQVAHERGIVHRDVKPQNVLLTDSGAAKVADFGVARAAADTTITRTDFVLGSAHYISPEQAMGHRVDRRTDLYSLGVVLYEMLTGNLPYQGETLGAIMMQHLSSEARAPKDANPNVPEWMDAVTVRLMDKDPEGRYASAAAVMRDLQQGAGIGPVPYLLGQSVSRASSTLTGMRLTLGERREAFSDTAPQGAIIDQDAAAGTTAALGTPVGVTVSKGSREIEDAEEPAEYPEQRSSTPPPVSHDTSSVRSPKRAAWIWAALLVVVPLIALALLAYGFTSYGTDEPPEVGPTQPYSSPPGSASPGPGSASGDNPPGPNLVEVPDVSGISAHSAVPRLSEAGLFWSGVRMSAGPDPVGIVMGTDPPVGSRVKRGTKVSLVVSTGSG